MRFWECSINLRQTQPHAQSLRPISASQRALEKVWTPLGSMGLKEVNLDMGYYWWNMSWKLAGNQHFCLPKIYREFLQLIPQANCRKGSCGQGSLELGWSVPQSIAGKCLSKGVEKDSNELDCLKYELVYTLYIRYFCSVSLHSWESTLIVWYVNGYFLCKSLKILV